MAYKRVVVSAYGGPDVLKVVEEAALPEPAAGEVRIKVEAASASFTDTMIRTGNYPGIPDKPPFSPGYDLVGVVDKLGPGVSGLSEGQRVADLTVYGAYTEYACLPAEKLTPVPEGLDPAAAVALVLSYTTAYQMLHRIAQLKAGQSFLVHGAAGAVGSACLHLGEIMGLKMFGTASGSKTEFVTNLGATGIDYKTEDFVQRVLAETDGAGVDAALDAISLDHFKQSFKTLNQTGKLVTYGFYSLTIGTDKSRMGAMFREIMMFQLYSLRWNYFSGGRKAIYYNITDTRKKQPAWFKQDLGQIFAWAAEGKIDPVIWRRMPLSEAAEAHRLIEARKPEGKIILVTDPDAAD